MAFGFAVNSTLLFVTVRLFLWPNKAFKRTGYARRLT